MGKEKGPAFSDWSEEYKTIITNTAPAIMDEIHGLADALDMDMEKAFRLFGGYYLEYTRSGCSVFTMQTLWCVTMTAIPGDTKEDIYSMRRLDQLCRHRSSMHPEDRWHERRAGDGVQLSPAKSGDGFICTGSGRLTGCADSRGRLLIRKTAP